MASLKQKKSRLPTVTKLGAYRENVFQTPRWWYKMKELIIMQELSNFR